MHLDRKYILHGHGHHVILFADLLGFGRNLRIAAQLANHTQGGQFGSLSHGKWQTALKGLCGLAAFFCNGEQFCIVFGRFLNVLRILQLRKRLGQLEVAEAVITPRTNVNNCGEGHRKRKVRHAGQDKKFDFVFCADKAKSSHRYTSNLQIAMFSIPQRRKKATKKPL